VLFPWALHVGFEGARDGSALDVHLVSHVSSLSQPNTRCAPVSGSNATSARTICVNISQSGTVTVLNRHTLGCLLAAVRNSDTVGNGSDPHHLRRAYIHLFDFQADANPNQNSGTVLGSAGPYRAPAHAQEPRRCLASSHRSRASADSLEIHCRRCPSRVPLRWNHYASVRALAVRLDCSRGSSKRSRGAKLFTQL